MLYIQKGMYRCIWHILLTFLMAVSAFAVESVESTEIQATTSSHYFSATYFHTTLRCPTCHRIETLSAEAIKKTFAKELKEGVLVWRAITVDESENRHYNADYQLFTKSIIIYEVAFNQYVTSELKAWMAPE